MLNEGNVQFDQVIRQELTHINDRRYWQATRRAPSQNAEANTAESRHPRAHVTATFKDEHTIDEIGWRDGQGKLHNDLLGLALSGGGIRSSAFCLGALQALDRRDV